MPIIHIAGKLVCFHHVPRSGGSAVEDYLTQRFGAIGFLDRRYLKQDEQLRWNKSSPQHIAPDALFKLLPASFFAESFAMVRSPLDRLLSVFRYQRDLEHTLPEDVDLKTWLDELPGIQKDNPFYLDNHPRPMCELVPEHATVFRLEDGMEPIVKWLDQVEGAKRAPREIPVGNSFRQRMEGLKRDPEVEIPVSDAARKKIHDMFSDDYARFGYDKV